jgi:hypothetical protein
MWVMRREMRRIATRICGRLKAELDTFYWHKSQFIFLKTPLANRGG